MAVFDRCQNTYIFGGNFSHPSGNPPCHDNTNLLQPVFKLLRKRVEVSAFHFYDPRLEAPPARCAPGTRLDILNDIKSWVTDDANPHLRMMWLHGAELSGKSVIGRTIADWCEADNRLLATFFVQNDGSFRHAVQTSFVATLAYAISFSLSQCRQHISHVVSNDPYVFDRSIIDQFRKLVVQPLQQVSQVCKQPRVIIIDGLDQVPESVKKQLLQMFLDAPLPSQKILFLTREAMPSEFSPCCRTIHLKEDWDTCLESQSEHNSTESGSDSTAPLIAIHRSTTRRPSSPINTTLEPLLGDKVIQDSETNWSVLSSYTDLRDSDASWSVVSRACTSSYGVTSLSDSPVSKRGFVPNEGPLVESPLSMARQLSTSTENLDLSGLSQEDIIVGVTGPFGSGKSHFIELLSGIPKTPVHEPPGIRAVRVHQHAIYQDRLVLVEFPGLNDANEVCRTDSEVFNRTAEWLKETYKSGLVLSGIIYLHRITDSRPRGCALRHLQLFYEICGNEAAEAVLFASTMWDKNPNPQKGIAREAAFQQVYWAKELLAHGARSRRLDNTKMTASAVINELLTREEKNQCHALLLQEELIDKGLQVEHTKAARHVRDSTHAWLFQQQKILEQLEHDARRPESADIAVEIYGERDRIRKGVEMTKKHLGLQDNMNSAIKNRFATYLSRNLSSATNLKRSRMNQ